jgi:glycosyltransferase involved in cell wall biosynthesis
MIRGPVPVFIISFNRGDWLRRCVAACRKLATSVDVVIHDNGSDDPSTLRCLELFEAEGIAVVRRGKIRDSAELNQLNDTIACYLAGRAPAPYVVTALGVYDELLDMFPDAPCVGPMIRSRAAAPRPRAAIAGGRELRVRPEPGLPPRRPAHRRQPRKGIGAAASRPPRRHRAARALPPARQPTTRPARGSAPPSSRR